MVADDAAREAGEDRRPDGCPTVALCRDPTANRPATRIARADDMTVGDQMADDDEGRPMRKSPPEVCRAQSPRRMQPSLAAPDAGNATAGGLPIDGHDAEAHRPPLRRGSSGKSRLMWPPGGSLGPQHVLSQCLCTRSAP